MPGMDEDFTTIDLDELAAAAEAIAAAEVDKEDPKDTAYDAEATESGPPVPPAT